MNKKLFILCLLVFFLHSILNYAGEKEKKLISMSLEDLLNIEIDVGARGTKNKIAKSPIPIDVITGEELVNTGYSDLTNALKSLIPSINYPISSLNDGSDHQPPFTLKGMSSDQVLVLVNGKRFIKGALLHLNRTIGRGSQSTDINVIPIYAIDRVEVLKDGASAQYGSDAISGIINIILKNSFEKTELNTLMGITSKGDGEFVETDISSGKIINNWTVFYDASIKAQDNTNRAGPDIRQLYFDGDERNEQYVNNPPVTFQYGSPKLFELSFVFNSSKELDINKEFYSFFTLSKRFSESGAFFRPPRSNNNIREIYPDGYLPQITPEISTYTFYTGYKNVISGWNNDFSIALKENSFEFNVENSLNPSMGLSSPTDFYCGTLINSEISFSVDSFKSLDIGFKNPIEVAIGAEFRFENYEIRAGDESSYINGGVHVLDGPNEGDLIIGGSQGFPGFKPENEVSETRHNLGIYLNLRNKFKDNQLLEFSLRLTKYSDFGSNVTGKLSYLYNCFKNLSFRFSVNSGFKAPTLAQSYFTSTATLFENLQPVEVGLFPVNSEISKSLGAVDLKPEKSLQFSGGFVYQLNKLFISLDIYQLMLNDKIMLTDNIYNNPEKFDESIIDILNMYGVGGIRFFTNAIDIVNTGGNFTLRYEPDFGNDKMLKILVAYHFHDIRINDFNVPEMLIENEDVILSRRKKLKIEEGQPNSNLVISAEYIFKNNVFKCDLNRYDNFKFALSQENPQYDQTFGGMWTCDLMYKKNISEKVQFTIGAKNIFNKYPEKIFFPGTYIVGQILQYHQFSPSGFNGASFFTKFTYRF